MGLEIQRTPHNVVFYSLFFIKDLPLAGTARDRGRSSTRPNTRWFIVTRLPESSPVLCSRCVWSSRSADWVGLYGWARTFIATTTPTRRSVININLTFTFSYHYSLRKKNERGYNRARMNVDKWKVKGNKTRTPLTYLFAMLLSFWTPCLQPFFLPSFVYR